MNEFDKYVDMIMLNRNEEFKEKLLKMIENITKEKFKKVLFIAPQIDEHDAGADLCAILEREGGETVKLKITYIGNEEDLKLKLKDYEKKDIMN